MLQAILFAVLASSALVIGAAVGVWSAPPRRVVAALLAFASGALITAVAFELFSAAYDAAPWRAAIAFFAGASVFVLATRWLDRHTSRLGGAGGAAGGAAVGFALLAGVVLDGVPENLAMGVSLIEGSGLAMLVAIFASNLPEALVGAVKMRQAHLGPGRVMAIWIGAAIALAIPVVAGYGLLEGVAPATLAVPLGFAAGAVLASLADTLMPEAFDEGGPAVAYATALGFLASFAVASL